MTTGTVIWKLALRSLVRQSRRNLISLVMIAIAFTSLILVAGHRYRGDMHMRTTAAYLNHRGHISVFFRDGSLSHLTDRKKYSLKPEHQDAIEKIATLPEVEMIGRYLIVPGMLSNGCKSVPVILNGIDMAIESRVADHPRVLQWTPELHASRKGVSLQPLPGDGPGPILLAPMVAERLGKPAEIRWPTAKHGPTVPDCNNPDDIAALAGDPLVQIMVADSFGDVGLADAGIVGQYRTGILFLDDVSVAVPLQLLQETISEPVVTYLGVYLKDPEREEAVLATLNQHFAQHNLPFEALSATGKELDLLYDGIMKWFWAVEIFVYILLGFITVITIFNFLTMTILERRGEIGALRAIGFKPRLIARIFQLETILLTGSGIVLGGLLACISMAIINQMQIEYRPPGVPGVIYFILAADARLYLERAVGLLLVAMICSMLVIRWETHRGNISKLLTSH